jgi:hypothetical protein
MAEEKKQEKKIIIDEDWKNKAQKEKEALADKEESKQEQQHQLPPGDFSSLVSLLATQALFAMGLIATEENAEPKKDLRLAKFQIDMLESLEEKTKGNLTEQEQKFLAGALGQLRMGFVEASK